MQAASEVAVGAGARESPAHFTYASGDRPLAGYTIKRGIGAGGFGEVYYATSDAGKDVALKLIRRNLDVELRGVRQCLNVKHPHLLSLYDVRQDEQGNSWVIMEYVSGECLEECLARHPQGLPSAEAMSWFRGVAMAVAHLHEQGIVHRDLKPGNIFRDQGVIKLGDYGLSKFISVSRRSGQTESIGTVHYMAPEIAKGRYGKEIDIYALGVLLYELLTGRVPFEGESVGEVLMKHLTAQLDVSQLAEPYCSVVAACLAKDPSQRPQSVGELLARLAGATPQNGPASRSAEADTAFAPKAGTSSASNPRVSGPVRFWNSLTTPSKVLVSLVAVYVLMHTAPSAPRLRIWPMVAAGLGIYLYLRATQKKTGQKLPAGSPARQAISAEQAMPAALSQPVRIPVRVAAMRAPPIPLSSTKTSREHMAELLGSMIFAAAVAAALVVLGSAVRGVQPAPQQVAWQWLVGTLGSWIVLVPAKLWEGKPGDDSLRRFVMLMLGLGLGAFAWGVAEYLWVDLPYNSPILERVGGGLGPDAFEANGQPKLLAYLAYFGLLMLLPRWWLQADARRPRRVNLWSTTLCVCYALVLNEFCAFPQPWAMLVAGTMSLATQLSSGWRPRLPAGRRAV